MNFELIEEIAGKNLDDIKQIIKSSHSYKYEAIKALGKMNTTESKKALFDLLSDKDLYVKRAALEECGKIESKEVVFEIISNNAYDKKDVNEFLIRTSLLIIEERSINSLHDFVIKNLDSNNPSTVEYALRTINEIWEDNDFNVILKKLGKESDEKNKKIYYEVLCNHANNSNWILIYRLIYKNRIPQIRFLACKLLIDNYTVEFQDDLLHFAKDSDGHIRKLATKYMAQKLV